MRKNMGKLNARKKKWPKKERKVEKNDSSYIFMYFPKIKSSFAKNIYIQFNKTAVTTF